MRQRREDLENVERLRHKSIHAPDEASSVADGDYVASPP
jgi:hypothetical protein